MGRTRPPAQLGRWRRGPSRAYGSINPLCVGDVEPRPTARGSPPRDRTANRPGGPNGPGGPTIFRSPQGFWESMGGPNCEGCNSKLGYILWGRGSPLGERTLNLLVSKPGRNRTCFPRLGRFNMTIKQFGTNGSP